MPIKMTPSDNNHDVIDLRSRFVSNDTLRTLRELADLTEAGVILGIAYVAVAREGRQVRGFTGRIIDDPSPVLSPLMRLIHELSEEADAKSYKP